MKSPYEVLGVKPKAAMSTLRKAYRKKALQHHPDRGGDADLFHAVNEAWRMLQDPEIKERGDRTGEWDAKTPDNQFAVTANWIGFWLPQILDQMSNDLSRPFSRIDLIAQLQGALTKDMSMIKHEIKKGEQLLLRGKEMLTRLTDPDGVIKHTWGITAAKIQERTEMLVKELKKRGEVKVYLERCHYEPERMDRFLASATDGVSFVWR